MVIHAQPSADEEPPRDAIVVHLVGFCGALDAQAVESVQARLFALADESSRCNLILEFGNVGYISARAVSMLLALRDRLRAADRELAIQHVCEPVHEVLRILHVGGLFDLRSSFCGEPAHPPHPAASIITPPRRAPSSSRDVFIVALPGRSPRMAHSLIQPVVNDDVRSADAPRAS